MSEKQTRSYSYPYEATGMELAIESIIYKSDPFERLKLERLLIAPSQITLPINLAKWLAGNSRTDEDKGLVKGMLPVFKHLAHEYAQSAQKETEKT